MFRVDQRNMGKGWQRTVHVVGAVPSQLPSAKHVRVISPPLTTWPAVQEYVATLPTTRPPSPYAIVIPLGYGSVMQVIYRSTYISSVR